MQYTTIPAGAKPPAASLSPDTLRSSGGNRGPPPPRPRPCPCPDSPPSRRRLATSPARVGGKVERRADRWDRLGEGAQEATRVEGREGRQKGGAERWGGSRGWRGAGNEWREAPDPTGLRPGRARSREAPAPGAARDAEPAPDPGAPRLLPHSALRFRLWRVRRGLCGRAGARVPGSGPPPPGSARVLAGPREPHCRRSTPSGARSSAPPARAGTMEPKLVPRRRGGGRAPVRRPGFPDPVAPLSSTGRRPSRFWQPGLHSPAGAPAPRLARLPHWSPAPRGAPLGPEKSPRAPPLFQLRRALAAGEGELRAQPGLLRALRLDQSSGSRSPPPRKPPHQCPQERSERCAPAGREDSLSHSHPALVPPPPPPPAAACWAL
ncbi:basic proline-rich protein-like [Lagenorhynchus albirostris]|uniref:basic proline-rich protein-like n=1 Tax=Lagenorhynchus albirostris TaxID=27610 RepID=UPI0028EB2A13|nr:basic proline-rich protein-like [Lagenorhynchus albirostris]